MNLLEMTTDQLVTMWLVSDRNPDLKTALNQELQNRITNNTSFSREFFFAWKMKGGKVMNIYFIPGSPSYLLQGQYITALEFQFEGEEAATLALNCSSKPAVNTQGLISVDVLATNEERNQKIVTFSTKDVMKYESM